MFRVLFYNSNMPAIMVRVWYSMSGLGVVYSANIPGGGGGALLCMHPSQPQWDFLSMRVGRSNAWVEAAISTISFSMFWGLLFSIGVADYG